MLSNLRSAAIPLAALLITSLVLNGIITNVPVKAQATPSISRTGSGTITFSLCVGTNSPIQDPGCISFAAPLNPDGTVNTNLPHDFTINDFNPLVDPQTKYAGPITSVGVSGSSFTLTATYLDCGQIQTATIIGQCGTNQQITLESTGRAAFAGTGSGFCNIVRLPTHTTVTSATDGNGNPVQNGGSTVSTSIAFQVTATDRYQPYSRL